MKLRFSTQPPKTLEELHRRLVELLPQLETKILRNMEIGIEPTSIAHGLGRTPEFYRVTPHHLHIWCEDREPDKNYLYLRATGPVVVDIEVVG